MWRVSSVLRLNGLSQDLPEFTDETRDRGTAIHAANEAIAEGFEPVIARPEYVGYVDGLRSWYAEHQPVVVDSERRIVNRFKKLTGRVDLHAIVHGSPFTIDVKTGTGEAAWHGIQVAGYNLLGVEDDELWQLFGAVDARYKSLTTLNRDRALRRAVLYLPGDGTFKWRVKENPQDSYYFRAALAITVLRHEYGLLRYTDDEQPKDDLRDAVVVEATAF